ncbi:ABC transporter ATP-binding protein [Metallosphaera hakonensis]|uniref:Sugar ABC transporter ATP-binding protein n=1 Tax=Metallosphaera hakonensis JCM 8857 = DSM 7519 TaxID=1293036 RepID=A0A2U9ISI3_9CREN|nr:ABC transporter ATP-binding protein [Metallosphaera hakonensis]AWR98975.1 ATP-binding cassette domain-containing protein [Metallosphaera hakonensis JCM 8857 = DSM 7519]
MSIELKSISKSYRGIKALDSINLEIKKGEFFVILGPSGSGKTTLLRTVAGLERIDSGRILIDGKDVTEEPPHRRDLAMVFQNYALYPHKTVLENLIMPVEGKMNREEAVKLAGELASNLKIGDMLSRYPSELSGGQQQRVALARALMKKPSVFLMDEPLSNLDAIQRVSARKLIRDIQRENNITTLYVTHDQVEAMALADRIAIMNTGKVIQTGTPEEIYSNVKDRFVATFFGNPPMSLIDGSLLDLTGKIGVRPEDVEIGEGNVKGRVSDVEFLGDRYLVYISLGEEEVRAFYPYRLRGECSHAVILFDKYL